MKQEQEQKQDQVLQQQGQGQEQGQGQAFEIETNNQNQIRIECRLMSYEPSNMHRNGRELGLTVMRLVQALEVGCLSEVPT